MYGCSFVTLIILVRFARRTHREALFDGVFFSVCLISFPGQSILSAPLSFELLLSRLKFTIKLTLPFFKQVVTTRLKRENYLF